MIDQTHSIYPWQQHVWTTLTQRFPNLGHGLLFYGKNGCGKHEFTQQFVAWLLCLNQQLNSACGECASCLWLKSDTHPNYVYISTDEDNKKQNAKIKIEKIRDLQPFVQQTVEGWRVIVIDPAEALNIASSNALLKTLEEPGDRVVIILMADHYLKIPATIRSRLQHYALDRISIEQSEHYLKNHLSDASYDQIPLLLNLSNQMPLAALDLSTHEWLNQRKLFLEDWLTLVKNKSMPMQYASKWAKQLAFSDFLSMFEYLLADLIAVKSDHAILNLDLEFDALISQYHLEQLFDIYNDVQQAKLLVQQNVQTNLIIDQLFIKLMNVST